MDETLQLLPPSASTLSGEVDALFYTLLGLSLAVITGVVITAGVFAVRYRRGAQVERAYTTQKDVGKLQRRIEYTWIVIPLILFLITFFWGARLYSRQLSPPADAIEIYVVGKQWMWKLQHAQGRREINELHIPKGMPVKLVMTSQDVIHSFYIPAFRVKQDVVPGRYLSTWFEATRTGRFRFMCAEYCGTDHAQMHGHLVVMEPADYERWLQAGDAEQGGLAQQGRRLFRHYGCSGCHEPGAALRAPSLAGLYGKPVALEDGGTVIADERYIHDSIVQPRKHVVAGYEPIMPPFEGQIGAEEIIQIIAYIKSLDTQGGQ